MIRLLANAVVQRVTAQPTSTPKVVTAETHKSLPNCRENSKIQKDAVFTQALDNLIITTYSPCNPGVSLIILQSKPPTPSLPRRAMTIPTTMVSLPCSPMPPKVEELVKIEGTNSKKPIRLGIDARLLVSQPMIPTKPTMQWLFKLPSFLRPREGTTYYEAFSPNSATACTHNPSSFIQAILYGIPDPDHYAIHKEIGLDRILTTIMYNVKDQEGGAKKVVEATQTIEKKIVEIGGEEVPVKETKTEVKEVKQFDTEEVEEVGGFTVMAK
ncbi:hypothetical protein P280DRAFT_515796 [Massarina eburnea CBS 473.64]|uniref:Uncharacterized protein n=1 Tax=Massarina eburnea CBS 473.64 TaxID=1395130 RepID=A0A6A6S837_9PLEO|nr:hypothetical protein P280DRAFT_515796 [Massarina eburnea CBS 473.64]